MNNNQQDLTYCRISVGNFTLDHGFIFFQEAFKERPRSKTMTLLLYIDPILGLSHCKYRISFLTLENPKVNLTRAIMEFGKVLIIFTILATFLFHSSFPVIAQEVGKHI